MTLSRRSLLACFASLIVSPASSRTPMLTDMMTGVLYPAPGRIFEFGDVSTVYLRYIDAVGFRSRLVRGMGSGNEGVSERHRPTEGIALAPCTGNAAQPLPVELCTLRSGGVEGHARFISPTETGIASLAGCDGTSDPTSGRSCAGLRQQVSSPARFAKCTLTSGGIRGDLKMNRAIILCVKAAGCAAFFLMGLWAYFYLIQWLR